MKKLFLLVFMIFIASLNSEAQDRIDNKPSSLSYKSKEIKKAPFWRENSRTGKWESRKNTKLIYLGEGVAVDNFNSIFIGEYQEQRYLFLDFCKYSWRHPALKLNWMYYRTMMAALLSNEDYNRLSSISAGETLAINPRFYNTMFKGNAEYSFPFFLSLGETLRSSSETLYKSNKKAYREEYAEREWKKDYPTINFIILKRVVGSDGRDVIRFVLYPLAFEEFIDSAYFEVDYAVYRNLFTEDKKLSYK